MHTRLRRSASALLFLAGIILATPALAQADGDVKTQTLRFAQGKTTSTVHDVIRGYTSADYKLTLAASEKFSVGMRTSNRSSYFNIIAPGADSAIHMGDVSGNNFSGAAAQAGDYTIRVYLMRNAARRNETARFTLNVTRERVAAQNAPQGDFADGLAGGPDYWVVGGLRGRNTTALRHAPRASAAALARLPAGTIVKNLGCQMSGETRWCQVDHGDQRGWVVGRFLRESPAPASSRTSSDKMVPGTNYHATGNVPCKIAAAPSAAQCAFGVTRGGAGIATVFITMPSGARRVLGFSGGAVSALSGIKSLSSSRASDNTIVTIDGGAEQYTIPDALVNGG